MESLIKEINKLVKVSKQRKLTPEEKIRQKELREKYLSVFRKNLVNQLDRIKIIDPNSKSKEKTNDPKT